MRQGFSGYDIAVTKMHIYKENFDLLYELTQQHEDARLSEEAALIREDLLEELRALANKIDPS